MERKENDSIETVLVEDKSMSSDSLQNKEESSCKRFLDVHFWRYFRRSENKHSYFCCICCYYFDGECGCL